MKTLTPESEQAFPRVSPPVAIVNHIPHTTVMQTMMSFNIALGQVAHQQAEQASQDYGDWQKMEQVYLNALAVYAVDHYLQWMGFETNLVASQVQDHITPVLADVADLPIKNYGTVECRRVLPDATHMVVPPEVWRDRIGYIAVQLVETLEEAHLLGFVDQVQMTEISLSDLRSLDELPSYLQKFYTAPAVPLRQWLEGALAAGWQQLDALLAPQPDVALAFRNQMTGEKRGKRIVFEDTEIPPVIAVMTLNPTSDEEMEMRVELLPDEAQKYLPSGLQLVMLDAQGASLLKAQTSEETSSIQLEFAGEVGDRFSIKIGLEEFTLTEDFTV